jgi:hypothetical protein
MIITKEEERTIAIFKNVLSWLLCAQEPLHSKMFLAAISIIPNAGFEETVSRELILDLCANLVVFDKGLDTFRFAHLSVREFLEKMPEYIDTAVHSLAAEICLLNLISTTPNQSAERFLA